MLATGGTTYYLSTDMSCHITIEKSGIISTKYKAFSRSHDRENGRGQTDIRGLGTARLMVRRKLYDLLA